MAWHYYPYLRTEGGRWVVGPVFENELRAGMWLLQRLMEHLVREHRVRYGRTRWLEEITGEISRLLKRETPYAVCPLCSTMASTSYLITRFPLKRGARFNVVVESGGMETPARTDLRFQTAMREMIRLFDEHTRTHGAALEEESPGERAHLYTRYRCPKCAFAVEVVPVAELEAVM